MYYVICTVQIHVADTCIFFASIYSIYVHVHTLLDIAFEYNHLESYNLSRVMTLYLHEHEHVHIPVPTCTFFIVDFIL